MTLTGHDFLTSNFSLSFNFKDYYSSSQNSLLGWEIYKSVIIANSNGALTSQATDVEVESYLMSGLISVYGDNQSGTIDNLTLDYLDGSHYLLQTGLPSGSKKYYKGSPLINEPDISWRLSYCTSSGDANTIYSTVLSGLQMSNGSLNISPSGIYFLVNGINGVRDGYQLASITNLTIPYITPITNLSFSVIENTSVNRQLVPAGSTDVYSIAGVSWLTLSGGNIVGVAPEVSTDTTYTLNITKTVGSLSTTGTYTWVVVNNSEIFLQFLNAQGADISFNSAGRMIVQNCPASNAIHSALIHHTNKKIRVEFSTGTSMLLRTILMENFWFSSTLNATQIQINAHNSLGSTSTNYNNIQFLRIH